MLICIRTIIAKHNKNSHYLQDYGYAKEMHYNFYLAT